MGEDDPAAVGDLLTPAARTQRRRHGGAQRAPVRGMARGYTLTGRHGLFAIYEAFAMVAASMVVQ
jgi:hypothetical protein